jgi:hypothetical protein
MNLWLVDGNDAVKAALIPIWRWVGSTNAVRGEAEYYAPGRDGMPVLTEQPVIFPTTSAPDSPNADVEPELKNVLVMPWPLIALSNMSKFEEKSSGY